jgi:hypothetical protein
LRFPGVDVMEQFRPKFTDKTIFVKCKLVTMALHIWLESTLKSILLSNIIAVVKEHLTQVRVETCCANKV